MYQYQIKTPWGGTTRRSKCLYVALVATSDGWFRFARSIAAAEKELRYQIKRGKDGVIIPISMNDVVVI